MWVTGQELTAIVRAHLGEQATKSYADFAKALGLRGTDAAGGARVKRWSKGPGEPDYEGTIKLLDALEAIDWAKVADPRGSAADDMERLAAKTGRALDATPRRAEPQEETK